MDALGLAIREAFGLVVASTLPLFAIAAAAALLVGLLAGSLNIRDGAFGHIVRVLAVLLAIGLVIEVVASNTVEFATRSWAQLDGRP
jgi:type III secretory pathway component EscS